MNQNSNYEWVVPGEFIRDPYHQKMLLNPEEKKQTGYRESTAKYGKLRPVLYRSPDAPFTVDGIEYEANKRYVIDGWAYIQDAKAQGVPYVLALKVEAYTPEEIAQVIVEANSTYHTSYASLYRMVFALYEMYKKGRGFRSDKHEKIQAVETGDETPKEAEEVSAESGDELYDDSDDAEEVTNKRRPDTCEIIGAMMGGRSRNFIRYLLVVGQVDPQYFDRIDKNRMSLYAAYLHCRKELSGEKPSVPEEGEAVYYSTNTGVPEYDTPDTTADETAEDEEELHREEDPEQTEQHTSSNSSNSTSNDNGHISYTIDNSNAGYVIVCVTCPCGETTNIKVDRATIEGGKQ